MLRCSYFVGNIFIVVSYASVLGAPNTEAYETTEALLQAKYQNKSNSITSGLNHYIYIYIHCRLYTILPVRYITLIYNN